MQVAFASAVPPRGSLTVSAAPMNVSGAHPASAEVARPTTEHRRRRRMDWTDAALCAQTDPDLFFPAYRANSFARLARRICASCPVRAECLDYALGYPDLDGIWAGTTPRERQRLRRASCAASH